MGGGRIVFYGWNNKVIIKENTKITDLLIEIKNSSEIEIGEGAVFSGKNSVFLADESQLKIGKMCKFFSAKLVVGIGARLSILNNCTFGENDIIRTGYMGNIRIGEDCMFSWDVMILGNDGHAIFDVISGERSNLDKGLATEIGNHVWIGARCNILPKVKIADGSIIGTASVVTKTIGNNCIAAGNPAKIIKKDVAWHRNPAIRNIDLCPSQYVNLTDYIR